MSRNSNSPLRGRIRRNALWLALGLCVSGTALAQSNTSGSITGRVAAGDTIRVESPETGFTREVQAGADGSFRIGALPTGTYRVVRTSPDGTTSVQEGVSVSVGTGTPVNFSAAGASTLDAVVVRGTSVSPIDLSSVESATILTEAVIDRLPVNRSITDVALLAPGTTKGDSDFGNLPSFGGATVGENAYYLNGFNITNFRNGLGGSTVPFEFYREFQLKTGGYGAEFGRSTGGVINAISKSGTNEWKFGGNVIWTPDSLRENQPTVYDRDGNLYIYNDRDAYDAYRVNLYASGPIVKDRLFFYAMGEYRQTDQKTFGLSTANDYETNDPFWGVKLDWYITDDHRLEYTGFSDEQNRDLVVVPFSPTAEVPRTFEGRGTQRTGGQTNIFRYTGYLTDDFTVSALYGKGELENSVFNADGGQACNYVVDQRSSPSRRLGCAAYSQDSYAMDEREAYRLDFDWHLGDHRLRFGLDREQNTAYENTYYAGAGPVVEDVFPAERGPFPGGAYYQLRNGFVLEYAYLNEGGFETTSNAYYLEDNWQVTDNLLLSLGLRNEQFDNKNKAGESFIKITDQWAPRLGLSWDVGGEGTTKVFANYGRYHLPVATNTNIRMAGDEYYVLRVYDWDGTLDPSTNRPVIDPAGYWDGEPYVIYGDGTLHDTTSLVNRDIDPMYQDELIVGFQRQLTPEWSVGVRAIRRDLKSTLEDVAIDAALNAYAAANGYDDFQAGGFDYYVLTNPGKDMRVGIDMDGDGIVEDVFLTAEQLGYPDSVRKYNAVEVTFERGWDGVWFLQGSYTWSQSYGNNEGYVRSDNGQSDAGLTTLFDQPGLLDGAYGFLPNDRRHTIKVFGAYQFADEWRASGNVLWQTGRPINCFGNHPTDAFAAEYGSEAFYCGGVLTPRGTAGRTRQMFSLDLGLQYRPNWAQDRLAIGVDVFNVLDNSAELEVNEIGEFDFDPDSYPLSTWGVPTTFQAPREVRFSVSYDF